MNCFGILLKKSYNLLMLVTIEFCRESFFAVFITPRKTIDSSLFQLYLLGFLKILSKDTPSCQRRDVV